MNLKSKWNKEIGSIKVMPRKNWMFILLGIIYIFVGSTISNAGPEKTLEASQKFNKEVTQKMDNVHEALKVDKTEVPIKKIEAPKKKEIPRKPVILGAGKHIAGKDFPIGRYKATNVGRGSNFIVYGSDKNLKENTILGNGTIGSGDYTFWAENGDLIDTHAKVKLIPVK